MLLRSKVSKSYHVTFWPMHWRKPYFCHEKHTCAVFFWKMNKICCECSHHPHLKIRFKIHEIEAVLYITEKSFSLLNRYRTKTTTNKNRLYIYSLFHYFSIVHTFFILDLIGHISRNHEMSRVHDQVRLVVVTVCCTLGCGTSFRN